jgi:asparagine synthase (glutamine-hydrolysing)
MSGIAGALLFDDALDATDLVARITNRMQHLGPDGLEHRSSGRVGMGQCMLRATPEAALEVLPLADEERGLVMVWDGRLDNRDELYSALKPNFRSQGEPDSRYVLEAYARWGEECPQHLLGDFAFAVWDDRRQSMFCARDPVGACRLSYAQSAHFFAFATEPEALACLPGVGAEPNENYIAQMLVREFRNRKDRSSWLRNIHSLLPGESLWVSLRGDVSIKKYWTFEAGDFRQYSSYQDCEAHFLSIFGQAVRDRMRVSGDLAMMLSGGLDSAGLIAMSSRLAPEFPAISRHAYSTVDDDSESCIESQSIFSLAESNVVDLHTTAVPSMSGQVGEDELFNAAWSMAQPVANSILLPAMMALAASRDGHKAVLHAGSGDMAMGTPKYYMTQWLKEGRWHNAWQECQAASANNLFLQRQSAGTIWLHSAARAWAPGSVRRQWQSARLRWRPSPVGQSLINREFAERLHLEARIEEELRQTQQEQLGDPTAFRIDRCVASICSGLSGYGLVAGRSGIEARDPWSDIRVLDFMFRTPDTLKTRHGQTKFLVRSAFQPEVEPFVRNRKDKSHVGWKMVIRALSGAHRHLCQAMEEDAGLIEQYVDLKNFRKLAAGFEENRDVTNYLPVFETMTLLFWLKRIKSL